jgi:hypothetical protein
MNYEVVVGNGTDIKVDNSKCISAGLLKIKFETLDKALVHYPTKISLQYLGHEKSFVQTSPGVFTAKAILGETYNYNFERRLYECALDNYVCSNRMKMENHITQNCLVIIKEIVKHAFTTKMQNERRNIRILNTLNERGVNLVMETVAGMILLKSLILHTLQGLKSWLLGLIKIRST